LANFNTGDFLFTQGHGLFSKIISLFTHPVSFFRKEFTPSHVAMIRRDDSEIFVYESTTLKGGVARTPLDNWLAEHKKDRIHYVPMPFAGVRDVIAEELVRLEGTPYENWFKLAKVAFDANKAGANKLFCSEFLVRVLQEVGRRLKYTIPHSLTRNLDPNNTSPVELYKVVLTVSTPNAIK